MTDVWCLRQALADLRAAHSWYEERRPGTGDELADVVDAAIESIIAFPAARFVVYRETRRLLVDLSLPDVEWRGGSEYKTESFGSL